jgi:hypothetical protein
MKIKLFIHLFLLIFTFFIVFVLPKPEMRIERLKHQVQKNEILIIGSSVLNHTSPCDKNKLKVSDYFNNIGFISEGGLLIEEVSLTINQNKKLKQIIFVLTPYQFYQNNYYSLQTHLYYENFENLIKNYDNLPFTNKTLWRINENININGVMINRGDAALKIKEEYSLNRCDNNQNLNNQLLDSIYIHTNNNFFINQYQLKYIRDLNIKFNLKVIVLPVYTSDYFNSVKIMESEKLGYDEYINFFLDNQIDFEFLDIKNDISNYDEPWCMCGHLSEKGRQILIKSIKNKIR